MDSISLMKVAVAEAKKGSVALVHPNPRVGAALLLSDGNVLSAHHKEAGKAHAEQAVLDLCQKRGLDTQGSVMAITLEPCSHYGKTPPCANAVVAAGVKKIIVGGLDPFEAVSGKGLEIVKEAGIEVEGPVLEKECEAINREWLFGQRSNRPYVHLKMATSADGSWAAGNGESQWITSEAARAMGHEIRARVQGIGSSWNTIMADNPLYTVRLAPCPESGQPKLFILSRSEEKSFSEYKISKRLPLPEFVNSTDLNQALQRIFEKNVHAFLLEAGPTLSSTFLKENLVEEVHLFMASRFLGAREHGLRSLSETGLPGKEFEIASIKKIDSQNLYLNLVKAT